MRTIQAQPLDKASFAPFGQYYEMSAPEGHALCGALHAFYPDRLSVSSAEPVGFSPLVVKKPERMIIDAVELHTHSWELLLPLNDDAVIHVSPPSGMAPEPSMTKAFIVPKGTLVMLDRAVWHLAPLPVHEEKLYAMVALNQCTYLNDCAVVQLSPDDQMEIVL
jgi:ureidoglycolate hydrolase